MYFEKAFTITITPEVIQNPILNGDFELGPVNWEQFSTHGWDVIVQSFPGTVTPYNGTWAAWLGGDMMIHCIYPTAGFCFQWTSISLLLALDRFRGCLWL